MARTVRQVIADVKRTQSELAVLLANLEAGGEGYSDLAWRARDYCSAVDRLVAATPISDKSI